MTTLDFEADWLSPPGDTILGALEGRQAEKTELVAALRGVVDNVDDLLAGIVPLTQEVAAVLTKTIGGSPTFWLARENQYRAAWTKRANQLDADECAAWLESFPVTGMINRGDLRTHRDIKARAIHCLQFFGVSTIQAWQEKYSSIITGVTFRTSQAFRSDPSATILWLREGQLRAASIATAAWDPAKLQERIPAMRELTRVHEPIEFVGALSMLCQECGVALVVRRTPEKCRASGAVMALPRNRMLLMMSFRHRSDDHFWFTFFHEVGHLLLHINAAAVIVDEDSDMSQQTQETEANAFAADVLVPRTNQPELAGLSRNMWQVGRFARRIGISPGVVVGQLQHLGVFRHDQMNHLKRHFTEAQVESATL